LRGRTLTVWDDDERHAIAIAHEWLDYSEKLGIDPLASATVERIGDERHPEDIVGTSLPGSALRPVPTLADGGPARTIEKTLGVVAIVAAIAIVIAAVAGSVSAPWLLIVSNLFVIGLLVFRWFVARNRWKRIERDLANE
jgi:Flp pilus assembly protein TadB